MVEKIDHIGKHKSFARYINPEDASAERWTELFSFIEDDDFEEFQKTLAAQEEIPSTESCAVEIFGYQSIVAHAAAFSLTILEYLVEEKKCDVNLRSSGVKDQTPLFAAKGPCIEYLLQQGADQKAYNAAGDTALHAAIRRGDYDQAVEFLRYGFSPSVKDKSESTAIFLAVSHEADMGMEFAQEKFWNEFFDVLCEDKPQEMRRLINTKCRGGNSCLHVAVAKERIPLVRKLLEYGANTEVRNDEGDMPHVPSECSEGLVVRSFEESSESSSSLIRSNATSTGMSTIMEEDVDYDEFVDGFRTSEEPVFHLGILEGEDDIEDKNDDDKVENLMHSIDDDDEQKEKKHDEDRKIEFETTDSSDTTSLLPSASQTSHEDDPHDELPLRNAEDNSGMRKSILHDPTKKSFIDLSDTGGLLTIPVSEKRVSFSKIGIEECLGQKQAGKLSGSVGSLVLEDESETSSEDDEDASYIEDDFEDKCLTVFEREMRQLDLDHDNALLAYSNTIKRLQIHETENKQLHRAAYFIVAAKFENFALSSSPICSSQATPEFSSRMDKQKSLQSTDTTESTYATTLKQVDDLVKEHESHERRIAETVQQLEQTLSEKQAKVMECREVFSAFKKNAFRDVEMSQIGKSLLKLEELEEQKDKNLEEVRATNIALKNKLSYFHSRLKSNYEQSANLHIVDFEQLKMENSALHGKLNDRSTEVEKLNKKTVTTIQMISHWREKLHFLEKQTRGYREEFQQVDTALASHRDLIAKAKQGRDTYRTENVKLRQQTGITNSELLTDGLEKRQQSIAKLTEKLEHTTRRHRSLTMFIEEGKQTLRSLAQNSKNHYEQIPPIASKPSLMAKRPKNPSS